MKERNCGKAEQSKVEIEKEETYITIDSVLPHLGSHLAGDEFNLDLEKKTDDLGSPIGRHLAGGDFNPDLEQHPEDLDNPIGRHFAGEDL
jgi:hypothetical protein